MHPLVNLLLLHMQELHFSVVLVMAEALVEFCWMDLDVVAQRCHSSTVLAMALVVTGVDIQKMWECHVKVRLIHIIIIIDRILIVYVM